MEIIKMIFDSIQKVFIMLKNTNTGFGFSWLSFIIGYFLIHQLISFYFEFMGNKGEDHNG